MNFEALRLDEGTRRLVFILCLPLIDGVFATLLVTGALETFSSIVAVGLTVFSGAGALTVLYSYSDSVADAKRMVLRASPVLVLGVVAVALIAPVFEQIFYVERLQYAAGLALLVIASQLADMPYSQVLSTPAIIVTGMVLSVRNFGALSLGFEYVLPALFTAFVAGSTLYLATYLKNRDLSMVHIRRGGAAVLAIIGLSMLGLQLPSGLGLAVFSVSIIASLR